MHANRLGGSRVLILWLKVGDSHEINVRKPLAYILPRVYWIVSSPSITWYTWASV